MGRRRYPTLVRRRCSPGLAFPHDCRYWSSITRFRSRSTCAAIGAQRIEGEEMRRRPQTIRALRWAAGAALAVFLGPRAHACEPLTLGLNKGAGSGPAYIAIERGYFAAEGFDVKLAYFDAAEPI